MEPTTENAPAAPSEHRLAWKPRWEKGVKVADPTILNTPYGRGRRIWGWALAIAIVAIIVIPIAFVSIPVVQNFSVLDTAKQFCMDETGGSYGAAYGMLSQRAQQSVSPTQFNNASQKANIASCSPEQNGLSFSAPPSPFTIAMSYTIFTPTPNASTGTATPSGTETNNPMETDDQGTMRLVRQGNGWRVDAISTTLFTLFS